MPRVTAKLSSGTVVHISNGRHEWTGDEPEKGLIEQITSNVHIEGDFDEAQRKRLAQIAQRCPVHKTLANGVQFEDHATF